MQNALKWINQHKGWWWPIFKKGVIVIGPSFVAAWETKKDAIVSLHRMHESCKNRFFATDRRPKKFIGVRNLDFFRCPNLQFFCVPLFDFLSLSEFDKKFQMGNNWFQICKVQRNIEPGHGQSLTSLVIFLQLKEFLFVVLLTFPRVFQLISCLSASFNVLKQLWGLPVRVALFVKYLLQYLFAS